MKNMRDPIQARSKFYASKEGGSGAYFERQRQDAKDLRLMRSMKACGGPKNKDEKVALANAQLRAQDRWERQLDSYIRNYLGLDSSNMSAKDKAKYGKKFGVINAKPKIQADGLKYNPETGMYEAGGGFFSSVFGKVLLAVAAIVITIATSGGALAMMSGAGGFFAGSGAALSGGGMMAATAGATQAVGLGMQMAATAIGSFAGQVVTGSIRMIETGGKWFKQVVAPAAIGSAAAAATAFIGHGPLEKLWTSGPSTTVPGINQVVDGIQQARPIYLSEITLKPLLHGAVQGGFSELRSGDFMDGFASAALSYPLIATRGYSAALGAAICVRGLIGRGCLGYF